MDTVRGGSRFNVKGGRCEACHGGRHFEDRNELPAGVYVDCEECHGKRYNRETLEVKYNGKSVADVLGMPIEEAAQSSKRIPPSPAYLDTLVQVGLGISDSDSLLQRFPAANRSV